MTKMDNSIPSESVAYWFFRLNGFLTTTNFVIHKDNGDQGTDADIIGVRFPFRAELFENPMVDFDRFTIVQDKPYIVITECKRSGECRLNGPWTNPSKRNVQRVLRAIGAFSLHAVDEVAAALYREGFYENRSYILSLSCVAEKSSQSLAQKFPNVIQIEWIEILRFIWCRFYDYRNQKRCHPQWDQVGRVLWEQFEVAHDVDTYVGEILRVMH